MEVSPGGHSRVPNVHLQAVEGLREVAQGYLLLLRSLGRFFVPRGPGAFTKRGSGTKFIWCPTSLAEARWQGLGYPRAAYTSDAFLPEPPRGQRDRARCSAHLGIRRDSVAILAQAIVLASHPRMWGTDWDDEVSSPHAHSPNRHPKRPPAALRFMFFPTPTPSVAASMRWLHSELAWGRT